MKKPAVIAQCGLSGAAVKPEFCLGDSFNLGQHRCAYALLVAVGANVFFNLRTALSAPVLYECAVQQFRDDGAAPTARTLQQAVDS